MKKYLLFLSLSAVLTLSSVFIVRAFQQNVSTSLYGENITCANDAQALFRLDVKSFKEHEESVIATVKKDFETLLSLKKNERNFENTARALDDMSLKLVRLEAAALMLSMVHPVKEIREEASAVRQRLHAYSVDTFMNKDLYKAFKEYVENNDQNEKLDDEKRLYLKDQMEEFARSGFELSDDNFEKLKNLQKEIQKISTEFDEEISQDSTKLHVTKEALKGVDEDFIAQLEVTDDGHVVLDCSYPTLDAVSPHCKFEQTRKDFSRAFGNRAYPANVARLHLLIQKRHEMAKLLGRKSYAHLDTERVMIKNPERAQSFLSSLVAKAREKRAEDFELLKQNLPADVSLTADGKFKQWDLSYVSTRYKKKYFDVDERVIAEYFPLEHTLQELFSLYQTFLGLTFAFIETKNLWHEDVRCIEVRNTSDKALRGYLFLDLFPRENKYSHACHGGIIPSLKKSDGRVSPSVAMVVANFSKSTEKKPSLLQHSEVLTFFHEFGHGMHFLLSATKLSEYAGTSVKRDFVEMPSQMFEGWMWDKEILKSISAHYKTGESLPDDLIDKKIALKQFGVGDYVCGQALYSAFSLACFDHTCCQNTDALYKRLCAEYDSITEFDKKRHFQASFGHLMGYGAKYYTYLWSKVLALDAFEEIKKHGLLNPEIGKKLIADILGNGGSIDPDEMMKNFLGREPNQDAFLRDLGLNV